MNNESRTFLSLGAAMLCLATALGAYASHAFAADTDAAALNAFSTAVDYQFYHGFGLLAVSVFTQLEPRMRLVRVAGWLLVAGILLFCGGIYATAFGAPQSLAAVIPVGGIAFLLAWAVLALSTWATARTRTADPLA